MLAIFLIGAALAAPPPTITAPPAVFQACPPTEPARWYAQLGQRLSRDERAQVTASYERAVAEWSVCARVLDLDRWGLPPLEDPVARAIAATVQANPGTPTRVDGVREMAADYPAAAGLLALEELGLMRFVTQGEPAMRTGLAAAAFGPWGCTGDTLWIPGPGDEPLGLCADDRDIPTMAAAGLGALGTLAAASDRDGWMEAPTRAWRNRAWNLVEDTWFPTTGHPDTPLATATAGNPLDPDDGWAWIVTEPEGTTRWARRPSMRLTRAGLEHRDTQPIPATGLPPIAASPAVYVGPDVRVSALAESLWTTGVRRPLLAAQGREGVVELRMRWLPWPGLDTAYPGAAEIVFDAGVHTRATLQDTVVNAPGTGPVWLRMAPDATWAQVVGAVDAVHGLRPGPTVVSIAEPTADPQEGADPAAPEAPAPAP